MTGSPQKFSYADRQLKESLPQRVRMDASMVMSTAQHVQINRKDVAGYAQRLVQECPLVTSLDRDNHFVSDASTVATAAYVMALDSVNFGSGIFAEAQKAGVLLEYAPVAQGLKAAFSAGLCNSPEKWLELTVDACHDIFGVPKGRLTLLDDLMSDFCRHLRWTGGAVLQDFGSIRDMITDYQGRGLELLDIVSAWPHFRDIAHYQGKEIAIYKRAQIMLADLELALARVDAPHFGGLHELTCFADNMVPHVLRTDGILSYGRSLSDLIDSGNLVPAGSEMEIELRCAAIYAVELMRESLAGRYTAVNLDHMLWHRGYGAGFSTYQPHRSISTWY